MGYSKIKKIKIVNFRSIGSIEIDMSDSPIIALKGANEGGKSSVIRAFGAAAGNMWRPKHAQYIRTGTDGFAVLLELEDGTKVLRKKSNSLNGYTLLTPDGQRRDATKIDVDIPDYIEAVMGMYRDPETKESLQVRTCKDPLLFVSTTDGQNYKAMHNAINNYDVREATIKAKADAADLQAQADKKRAEVEVYKKQLEELPLLDTDYLQIVLSALERASGISDKFDTALQHASLVDELDGVGDMKKLKKCKLVDADVMRVYADAVRYYNELQGYQEIPVGKCDLVDSTVLHEFQQALHHLENMREANVFCVDDVDVVNTAVLSLFEQGCKRKAEVEKHSVNEVPNTVKTINQEALALFEKAKSHLTTKLEALESYDKLMVGIQKVTTAIKTSGIRVVTCDHCGHDVAVPMES